LDDIPATIRRYDPDRFFTALFAPAEKRDALFTLYAFNHELARAREVTSEPHMALIRLQWWREVVEGATRLHPVATPLRALLAAGTLAAADLDAMIAARETETEEIATLADWRAYLLGSAGSLMVAAGRLLGMADPEPLRPLGAAYGAAGVLRSVPVLTRQERCLLPADVLASHGLSPEAVIGGADPSPAILALAGAGRGFLHAVAVPKPAIAAALPVVLARRDLARPLAAAIPRGIGDKLAVTWAGLTGRLGLATA